MEGIIRLPSEEIYLTKKSPIMENAEEASECHRKRDEFYINDEQVSKALKDAVKFPKNSNYEIPTSEFGNDAITDFAFGKIAKDYGNFLKEAGINAMPVWLANCENKPFARQMWFRGLDGYYWSDLDSDDRLLYCNDWVRGVREVREAHGQKDLPDIQRIIKYSKNYVPEAARGEFEKGLRNLLEK